MRQSALHLAQLNVGRLVAAPQDPRVKLFMDNLDRINGLGKRMPGFVWMMQGSGAPGTGNTENPIGGDPRYVSNLTVWEDAASLEKFVWGTIHKQFYQRRAEWFERSGAAHFVMWYIPAGHKPTLDEALLRLKHLQQHGDSDHAFGWSHLRDVNMWQSHGCKKGSAA